MPASAPSSSTLDWITAIGTLGAVGVSVYVGVIREQLRRPSLSLAFEPGTSDAIIIRAFEVYQLDDDGPPEHEEYDVAYLRLRILNKRKRLAAEDAEVTITGLREILSAPMQRGNLRIDGQSLAFSNSVPTATRMTVSPGGERHVDLAHTALKEHPRQRAEIDVSPGPADSWQRSIAEGPLELELTVTARNADAVRYVLELHFHGGHVDPATIWQHFTVKNMRKLR